MLLQFAHLCTECTQGLARSLGSVISLSIIENAVTAACVRSNNRAFFQEQLCIDLFPVLTGFD